MTSQRRCVEPREREGNEVVPFSNRATGLASALDPATAIMIFDINLLCRKPGDDANRPIMLTTGRGVGCRFERGES